MRTLRFIQARGQTECCNEKALLIQSRPGGYVGRMCLKCKKKSDTAKLDHLPELQCECCEEILDVSQEIEGRNYFYVCKHCGRQWKLGDWLPNWKELFPYCGLAAHQDFWIK